MTLVPASGGSLSLRVLARALTGRGISAVVSSLAELTDGAPEGAGPHVVLLEADGDAKRVDQSCTAIRTALPEAKVVLLATSENHAHLVAQGLADGTVQRSSGLDVLLGALSAAAAGRTTPRRSRSAVPRQRDEANRAIATLTAREKEVLRLMSTGAPNAQVARHLDISPHTVRTHIQNVLAKLGAENRLAATAMARRAGILPSGPDAPPTLVTPLS